MIKRIISLIFLAACVLTPISLWADVHLTVLPVDGGNSLRLEKSDTGDKEVRIRITATDNTQYQVYQRITQPLMNERGETLSRSGLMVSALPGSNTAGTLYVQNLEAMNFSDQLIYTSTGQGTSDSFTLFYKVDPAEINASGNFRGEILYSVRPVGGARQDELVLNVFVEIPNDFKIATSTSAGKDILRLQSDRPAEQGGDYVEFAIDGNLGRNLKVYQEITEYPINQEGEDLDPHVIEFLTVGNSAGEAKFPTATALGRNRELVYSTAADRDQLQVQFQLVQSVVDNLKAGTYRGQLRYTIDSGSTQEVKDVKLEVTIKPVFKLVVDYPPGGVSFAKLLPNAPPQDKEVVVTIKTNLGKPYVIHQDINGLLANERGEEIPKEHFMLKQEILGGEGKIQSAEFTPVTAGDATLFSSDQKGAPAQFRVIYRQSPYADMKPGDYKTTILYSLEQI